MSVELDRGSPGKFDSRTLDRKTLSRWTGRIQHADRHKQPSGFEGKTPFRLQLLYLRCQGLDFERTN